MQKLLKLTVLYIVLLAPSVDAQVLITFNQAMPLLSPTQVKMLYLGKSRSINGFGRVRLADLPSGDSIRDGFYEQFLKQSQAQMNARWTRIAFSGRGRPPEILDAHDPNTIATWLRDNPNGIVYTNHDNIPDGAKIVLDLQGQINE